MADCTFTTKCRDQGPTKQIIFFVKAGHTGPNHVRDLRGVVEREKPQIGVLITMQEPTQPMHKEAASAGFYESPVGKHPRLQILTIEELLDGRTVDAPSRVQRVDVTFKKAPRTKWDEAHEQHALPLAAEPAPARYLRKRKRHR